MTYIYVKNHNDRVIYQIGVTSRNGGAEWKLAQKEADYYTRQTGNPAYLDVDNETKKAIMAKAKATRHEIS